jgi:hypothetical protein
MFPEGYDRVRTLVPEFLLGVCHNRPIMETSSLDFAYVDSDPKTQHPSACIYLKAVSHQDFGGVKADRMISGHCLSFIELDAEIRRLHAELDEIRSRAKKKFYKAHAAAAGA